MGTPSLLKNAEIALAEGRQEDALSAIKRAVKEPSIKPHEFHVCAKWIGQAVTDTASFETFEKIRVAILGGYTTGDIAAAVQCALLEENFAAVIYQSDFDTFRQEALDPSSALYSFKPELVLIAAGASNIQRFPDAWSPAEEIGRLLQTEAEQYRALWDALGTLNCPMLQHNFSRAARHLLGSVEAKLDWSPDRFIDALNRGLAEKAGPDVHWLDIDGLAARVGYQNWNDERLFFYAKLGFNSKYLKEYAHQFLGSFRALSGRSKKCLALDLDNTLWGGVIGEDGLTGIELGIDTPAGQAYRAFCDYLRALKDRGVILAVCSKNDPEPARAVFEKHPGMPLRLADFAAFYANWDDKAANLLKISEDLNLSLSSIVFVDDNPAECERVRQALPEVEVVLLPEEPASFVSHVDRLHFFDGERLSAEDRGRVASYAARAQSATLKRSHVDLATYLSDLEMTAEFREAGQADIDRLAQMEMKTNQFNLTVRRYPAKRIQELLSHPGTAIFACGLADKFTDHGLVSTLITVRNGDQLRIDSWLMSCRVFSRTLEHFIMNRLVAWAAPRGIKKIIGEYVLTEPNRKFAKLYGDFGFRHSPKTKDGAEEWVLDLPASCEPGKSYVQTRTGRVYKEAVS